jgi:hypothetical protein
LPKSSADLWHDDRKPRFFNCLEGKRMASGHTGNVVPGNVS